MRASTARSRRTCAPSPAVVSDSMEWRIGSSMLMEAALCKNRMEECSKFGKVEVRRKYPDRFSRNGSAEVAVCMQAIEMPRLGTGKTKVYIKFDSLPSAQKGHQNLHGRSFEARCESFPPGLFAKLTTCCCDVEGVWRRATTPRRNSKRGRSSEASLAPVFSGSDPTRECEMNVFLSCLDSFFYLAGLCVPCWLRGHPAS